MEAPAPSRPAAPAVVAVVVARNPGPWFEASLAALAAQDYSNLAVLILDAASDADPTARVRAVVPDAHVVRLEENRGFGWAANHVRSTVDGAAFYWFLHDDVAPAPGALGVLVDEGVRSNAGIVGAKLVQADDHRRILEVGESVDKTGERSVHAEPGELDQEQHDAVRDVFVVPGGCYLVRADLFDHIGGFDEGIDLLNDDLNLCWRAHVAGGRVVVAPDAVAAHHEALGERSDPAQRRRRLIRHRLRTLLVCYSPLHLARVLPQVLVVAVLEVVYSVVAGRRGQAADVVAAWRWNWSRRAEIRVWRTEVAAFRRVPDHDVRRLQIRGSARVQRFLRGQTSRGGTRSELVQQTAQDVVDAVRGGPARWWLAGWAIALVVMGVGSRHLLGGDVPRLGSLLPLDVGPVELARQYLSGWRETGLGSSSPPPTVLALLSVAGAVLLGGMELLRTVLVLGPLLVGVLGADRLVRPTGSFRARGVAVVAYATIPLAPDALAEGRWGALVSYAVAPWVLAGLGRAAGWVPFGGPAEPGGAAEGRRWLLGPRMLRLGLVLAVASALEPAVLVVTVAVAAGLALGSLVVGATAGVARVLATGLVACALALVLHLPWSLVLLDPSGGWDLVAGVPGQATGSDLRALLRFDLGPVGGTSLLYGLLGAAAVPLLIGRGWRFEWAVRGWVVALVLFGSTWAGGQGWLGVAVPAEETLLAPAAAALALVASLGVVAFEVDLRAFGFGWRQVAVGLGAVSFVLGAVPALVSATDGRWQMPAGDLGTTFAFLDAEDPGYRILWLGDADVLPLPGHRSTVDTPHDIAFALSTDGLPSVTDGWAPEPSPGLDRVDDALGLAVEGQTARLGALLAPMAVRYLVVPDAAAPRPLGGVRADPPAELLEALRGQLDLAQVVVNPAYTVYRNEAALPARAALTATDADLDGPGVPTGVSSSAEALFGTADAWQRWSGEVPGGGLVVHSAEADPRWRLTVEGDAASPTTLFGWAQGFETDAGGTATLRLAAAPLRWAAVVLQVGLWLVVIRRATRRTAGRP